MLILREEDVQEDVIALDHVWSQAETFILLPAKSGIVSDEWVERRLQQLPAELHTGHFGLLTSGSTGLPKLVMGRRDRAERLAEVLHRVQDSEPVQQTVLMLPLAYCYAFVNQWLWSRTQQRALVPTRGFRDSDSLRAALESAHDAMLCLIGAQMSLLDRHFGDVAFPGITRLHFAGGRFPEGQRDSIARRFPNARVFNNYGCAEAMPRLTVREVGEDRQAVDIGYPLPGVELSTDGDGILRFRSEYAAVGYLDEAGFRPIDPDTWVSTGDLGGQTGSGSWRLSGRAGDVYKRYGEKVALSQVLDLVGRHWPGLAAVYRERDTQGEEGHVLVLSPAPEKAQLRAILGAFRKHMPRAYWPLRVESVAEMPLLASGKIDGMAISRSKGEAVHWDQRI